MSKKPTIGNQGVAAKAISSAIHSQASPPEAVILKREATPKGDPALSAPIAATLLPVVAPPPPSAQVLQEEALTFMTSPVVKKYRKKFPSPSPLKPPVLLPQKKGLIGKLILKACKRAVSKGVLK